MTGQESTARRRTRRAEDVADAVVSTERLSGRPPSQRDVPELAAMLNHPDVVDWLGGPRSEESVRRAVAGIRRSWLRRGWSTWTFRRGDGELVGRVGLAPASVRGAQEVELLYTVVPKFWGQGYATEMSRAAVDMAIRTLEVDSLVAFTLQDNKRSRAVMERLGFVYEFDFEHAHLPHVLYRLRLDTHAASARDSD